MSEIIEKHETSINNFKVSTFGFFPNNAYECGSKSIVTELSSPFVTDKEINEALPSFIDKNTYSKNKIQNYKQKHIF